VIPFAPSLSAIRIRSRPWWFSLTTRRARPESCCIPSFHAYACRTCSDCTDLVQYREAATTTHDIGATPLCPYNNRVKSAASRYLMLPRQQDVSKEEQKKDSSARASTNIHISGLHARAVHNLKNSCHFHGILSLRHAAPTSAQKYFKLRSESPTLI
jgi:hypothetical protein